MPTFMLSNKVVLTVSTVASLCDILFLPKRKQVSQLYRDDLLGRIR